MATTGTVGHTAGPWQVITNALTSYIQLTGGPARKNMGKLAKGYDTSEADALLIAAAPDLLAACQAANNLLAKYGAGHAITTDEWCEIQSGLSGALHRATTVPPAAGEGETSR